MEQPTQNFDEKNVEEDQIDFDVVVVGAGLSGLTAANRLVSAGLSVQILEKANYAGGRLLTKKDSESFYAHELQSRLKEMIRSLKISKVGGAIGNDRKILHLNKNQILNESLPFYVPGEVYSFIKMVVSSIRSPYEKNFLQCVKFSQESFNNYIRITNLRDISALWYLIMLSGAGGFVQRLRVNLGDSNRFYVKGGLMTVARLLTENIEKANSIRYSEIVEKIQFSDDRAHVWTNKNAHYKCQYVVVAVPPLESSEIAVEPRLPASVAQAQSSFEQGKNVFFSGIRLRVQGDDTAKCLIDAGGSLRLAYGAPREEQRRVAGFLSSASADAGARSDVASTLSRCFGASSSNLDEYSETDWRDMPTGSPMNVLRPGSLASHVNVLAQTNGRVFFAASEYANYWPGTADGAIEAGESSACSVLANIRPQSMNRLEWILYKSKSVVHHIEESNAGVILAHNICFWINLYISLSFLRTAVLSISRGTKHT